jgi:hypothetical protein
MTYRTLSSLISFLVQSLPTVSKRALVIIGILVVVAVLLVAPQLAVIACEGGSGGAGCPQ